MTNEELQSSLEDIVGQLQMKKVYCATVVDVLESIVKAYKESNSCRFELKHIDLGSMKFYWKMGEYPDLDSASVRSAYFWDGRRMTKEEKTQFKAHFPDAFYRTLWKFIGQYGKQGFN